jgi:hypothetical protein
MTTMFAKLGDVGFLGHAPVTGNHLRAAFSERPPESAERPESSSTRARGPGPIRSRAEIDSMLSRPGVKRYAGLTISRSRSALCYEHQACRRRCAPGDATATIASPLKEVHRRLKVLPNPSCRRAPRGRRRSVVRLRHPAEHVGVGDDRGRPSVAPMTRGQRTHRSPLARRGRR